MSSTPNCEELLPAFTLILVFKKMKATTELAISVQSAAVK